MGSASITLSYFAPRVRLWNLRLESRGKEQAFLPAKQAGGLLSIIAQVSVRIVFVSFRISARSAATVYFFFSAGPSR